MKALWAIEPEEFRAFLSEMALKIKAGLGRDNPYINLSMPPAVPAGPSAGPVEDARRAGLPVQREGGLAVIHLRGPMMKNPGWLRWFGFASTQDVRGALQAALRDDDVEQILLRIESPGGEVDGTAELADDVRAAAKEKHVTAQVDGIAASAAYWVASQADAIYAGRMDLIGSIGVRMQLYDFSKMFAELGIEPVVIDTGPFKSTGAMGTEVTEAQRDYLQGLVDQFFGEFRQAVMNGRGMNEAAFNAVGDGRVFKAPEALNLGLIDRVQSSDETVLNFKRQAVRKARLAYSQAVNPANSQ